MKNVNVIAIFDHSQEKVLVCKRRKDPYQGLYNLVGGKIEAQENGMTAAYRELAEETGITVSDTHLIHLMDLTYYSDNTHLEVYFGYLNKNMTVHGEENDLFWINRDQDYSNENVFAGKGNLAHVMRCIRDYEDRKRDEIPQTNRPVSRSSS